MGLRRFLPVLAGVPLLAGGCSALGLGSGAGGGSATPATSPGPVSGAGWIVGATGTPTPSAGPSFGTRSPSPALPPVSFLAIAPGCEQSWRLDSVTIPMTVVPGAGSFTVTWPRQWNSDYRITAVPQPLISGTQPPYTWQNVPAPAGCTATATITGLTPGKPYVIWLDAPDSGYERDGSRHPYSGRSGVVYPL